MSAPPKQTLAKKTHIDQHRTGLRFDISTNIVSCHVSAQGGKLESKPRGFRSSSAADPATHLRSPSSARYNPFDLKNAKDLTSALEPFIMDPLHPSSDNKPDNKPLIRVISNKYPALSAPLDTAQFRLSNNGVCGIMDPCGFQEVVIQHWHWNRCQALLTKDQMSLLWSVLQRRAQINLAKKNVQYVQIMENHGVRSGASLPHPHSQVLALPFVPPDQKVRLEIAAKWFQKKSNNIFDHVMSSARADNRILIETEHAIAFIPFAVQRSYETWIMSKTCAKMEDEKYMEEIAELVRRSLLMLYHLKDDPDYNAIVRQAVPVLDLDDDKMSDWYRWHVCVIPHRKQSKWAGIKGYGDFVPVTGTPEQHAATMRTCLDMPAPVFASSDGESESESGRGSRSPGSENDVSKGRKVLLMCAAATAVGGVCHLFASFR